MNTEPSPTLGDFCFEQLETWAPPGLVDSMLVALGLDPLWTVEQLQTELAIAQRARALSVQPELQGRGVAAENAWNDGWNTCRASVLEAAP